MSPNVQHIPSKNSSLPFSSAVCIDDLILLSGEIGIDDAGVLGGSIEDQAQLALENIERTLKRLGCDRSAIVKSTIMLQDMGQWSRFNAVYADFFAGLPLPARSAFESSALALGAKVEIECIAIKR